MFEWLSQYFSSDAFMPHGHCYLWEPGLLWLQVLSNGLIGLSYVAISLTLAYLVRRGQYVPFKGMALAFGVFIVSCGLTHFLDVYVIWRPAYWLDGGVRAVTAIASVGTAVLLPTLVPRALALARGASAARARGIELEAAVDDLEDMYRKTRELEQLKTQFFANVSHELRTPLALIMGPAEKLAAADNLDAHQRRDTDLILRNARTLLKHVNDLLEVARLEGGKVEPDYARVDLARMMRLVAGHFDGLAEDRSVHYDVATPEHLEAELDRDQIHRVLLNLLSNAFKFTPSGGRVRCTVKATEDGRALIEVADSGPGIRPEERSVVFQRFRQADGGATRQHGGTGLGLAISEDFVTLHGGTISIQDAPEGGALFRIELPLRAPAGVEVHADRDGQQAIDESVARQALEELQSRVEALAPAEEGERPTVLVVEDNPDMNRFVRDTLSPDYDTEGVLNGAEGLDRALALRPDLIVSDIMMPEMSGDRLVEEVRRRSELETVPILLLTAKADDELRLRLLREGAQDYLMKPFSAGELRARVANLVTMKRARDVLQRELDLQMVDLETLAREVTHRKRELHTAYESMRVAREQAERANQLKSDFLSMISHELRTPLASLQLQLERLQVETRGEPSGDRHRLIERMGRSSGRLRELIDTLLEYARVQSGRLDITPQPTDVESLARAALDEVSDQAARKGLETRIEAPPSLPSLHSDPRLVRLILANLVGNAVKFTDEGEVVIRITAESGRHRIAVSDTGPGIPGHARARIFEPFEHLEPVRYKHTPGVGLGLALVREMVASLGGTVLLDSEERAGSTFTVELPSARATGKSE